MIKTLSKLAKTRSAVPILNTIKVEKGIATATDLDFYISCPVSGTKKHKETFHVHGFEKGFYIKSGCPAADFPEFKIKTNDIICKTKLNEKEIEAFKWVLQAASTEESRYYLNGINFAKNRICATDGHRLHMFAHQIGWAKSKNTKDAILPIRACKFILDMVRETKEKDLTISFYQGHRFSCRVGKAILYGKLIDGTFPDINRVIPKTIKKNKTVFDPKEIKDIYSKLLAIKKSVDGTYQTKTTTAISIENGKLKLTHLFEKTEYSFDVSTMIPFKIGFNARYLKDLCGGFLYYTNYHSPIKIIDKRGGVEKMAVLMPMRV